MKEVESLKPGRTEEIRAGKAMGANHGNLPWLLSGLAQLKEGGIAHGPIRTAAIKWFETPILPGPIISHGGVAIVYFFHQLWHRGPTEIDCDFASDIQVNSRNNEITARRDQMRDPPQAFFRFRRVHVAEKLVGHHEILRPEEICKLWIPGISHPPVNSFAQPGLNFQPAARLVEHRPRFFFGEPLKYGRADELLTFDRVNSLFGNLHNVFGDIDGVNHEFQVWPRGSDGPHNGIDFGSITTSHDGNF